MFTRRFYFLAFLIALPIAAFAAESGGGSLTLADALARALRESPELAAFNWEFRAGEARIIQARLKPNPELQFEIENPTGSAAFKNGEQMQNTLQLSQLIELGGKLPARVAVAQAERALADWEYQLKRVEVLKETTLAFIDALAAQRRIALAEEVAKVAEDTSILTDQRVNVGKAGTFESTRAGVAVASARIEVVQARREALAARARLAAQWGAKGADFDAVRGNLDQRPNVPAVAELRRRLDGNPALARWTAERAKRAATLAKEQAEARPDLTLAGGPRVEGKGGDATFVAGFSLPLPLRNRNQGNIAEARANLAKLDDEKRAAEARVFAELSAAYQRLEGAREEIAILDERVIPGARDAEKQLAEGYAAGRFAQLEVLEARKTLNESRAQQLKALAEYHKALAEIEALTAQPVTLPLHTSAPAMKAAKRK